MAANWLARVLRFRWNRTAPRPRRWRTRAQGCGDPSRGRSGRRLHLRHGLGRRRLTLRVAWDGRRACWRQERRDRRRIEHVDPGLDSRAWPSGQAKGVGFLDAPVGGSRAGRRRATEASSAATRKPTKLRVRRSRRWDTRWICSGLSARARPGSPSTTSSPQGRSPRSPRRSQSPRRLASGMSKSPSHPRRRPGEPDRQAQAAAHAGAGFRADRFRPQSHAEGRSLRHGARAVAWRAGRYDLRRGEGVRAR